MGLVQKILTQVGSGQFFVARVGSAIYGLVLILGFFFSFEKKKSLRGWVKKYPGQRRVGLSFTAVRSEPISTWRGMAKTTGWGSGRDRPWPDLTYLWPGYFLTQPEEIFFIQREKNWKIWHFMGNFLNPNHRWLTWPDSTQATKNWPGPITWIRRPWFGPGLGRSFDPSICLSNHLAWWLSQPGLRPKTVYKELL